MQYKLRRSAKRKTVCIRVRGGGVEVLAPAYTGRAEIEAFLARSAAWLEKQLAAQAREEAEFAAVREGRAVLIGGREKALFFTDGTEEETSGALHLKNAGRIRPYFKKTRGPLLIETAEEYARGAGFAPRSVRLCDYKSRWGSCDAEGNILLNWRLAMLPAELAGYVVVHELCHLIRLDHSRAFWEEMSARMPDCKKRRERLKAYAFLTRMYGGALWR